MISINWKPFFAKSAILVLLLLVYLQLPFLPSPIPSWQFAPKQLSLIQLIANPTFYHNRKIRVTGFLVLEFEDSALYFSEDTYLHGLSERVALEMSDSLKPFKKNSLNYFIIEGNYNALCCQFKMRSYGKINQITRMDIWSDRKTPRRVLRPLLNAATSLIEEGMSREKVSQLTGLSLEKINEYIPQHWPIADD